MAFGLILTVQTKESGHKTSDIFQVLEFFSLMNYQYFLHLMANCLMCTILPKSLPSQVRYDLRLVKSLFSVR